MKRAVWCRPALLGALAALFLALLVFNLGLGDKPIEQRLERVIHTADPRFVRTMSVLLGPPLVGGNEVRELLNGEQIFGAMLADMRSAQHSITFESYVFFSGSIAGEFVDVLSERARSGVEVRVLLDWIGGQIDSTQIARLRANGVKVRRYRAPRWNNLQIMNNRTHRKLLVVDGHTGFTGGAGIADRWRGNARSPAEWRDTHFRVTGPVVGQMQAVFADNWLQASGEVLLGDAYFPAPRAEGTTVAQMFSTSPGGDEISSMQLLYLLSISAAQHSIDLSAAYFVPDDAGLAELAAAARRGVRVRIIVPGEHIDWNWVRRASRSSWEVLLAAGVEIYEYRPTMYHVKMMVVDGVWVTVGSTNVDQRSFVINDEANLNVYDAAFARRQTVVFEADLLRSRRTTLADWRKRSWQDRTLDAAAALLRSQL